MKASEEKQISKKRLLGSAFYFVLCYIVLLAVILIMIFVLHGSEFATYMRANYSRLLTLCVSTLMLYFIVYYYYYFEDRTFFNRASNIFLVFTLLTSSLIICYLFGIYTYIYFRPTIMLAMLCVCLLNRRQAIMLNFVFSILMFVTDIYLEEFNSFDYENTKYFSMMLTFLCGTFAVFVAGRVRTRIGLLLSGCFVAMPTVLIVFLLKLPGVYELGWIQLVSSIGFSVLGCLISSILVLALLPVFEFGFNRLTVFRLCELTSTNAPLLKRLQREAPGTFNHSLIVAQLSETCAVAIGENAELARAAAYYHDVGKLKQPDCFTENQSGYNVHDELMPELSADIIRSHAKDGYDLITSSRLPAIIADVAREHHGTLPIKYFYNKAVRLSGDADVKDYSYLGPTPQTKIAAIVMIADAAEASTRALQNRTPENVERVVRSIIEERMDLGQFDECNITMRELTTIKLTLVEALSGVHHSRVAYPAIRFNSKREAVKEDIPEDER